MSDTILTPWGYEVGADALSPLLSVSDFRDLTGDRLSSTDDVIEARLRAASSVVRDFCRWHVAPTLACSCTLDGGSRTLWLPCMGVRSVTSVTGPDGEIELYEWASRGELRLGQAAPEGLRAVRVEFVAGFDAAATQAIAQVVCQLAENAMFATPGLREEHAGGVGATYNQTASGVSGGVRLLPSDMAALAPYRIVTA